MCRKHELTQFELEMSSQDLVSKKQQREELATGVNHTWFSFSFSHNESTDESADLFQCPDSTVRAALFRRTLTEA